MGKATKWIKKLFTRKKDKEKKPSPQAYSFYESKILTRSASLRVPPPPPPPETPKLKRGGSFRLSPSRVPTVKPVDNVVTESWIEQKKVVAAAVAAATAKLAGAVAYRRSRVVEEAAAVTIQSLFRSYLARKALKALKGVVTLQALVRGYLVRRQTTATLNCMMSLATAQARARSDRIRMTDELNSTYWVRPNHRKSDWRSRQSSYDQETDWGMDENIRIVEMDVRQSRQSPNRKSPSHHPQTPPKNHRPPKGSVPNSPYSNQEHRNSPLKPSSLTGSRSMRFDDRYFDTTQSIPEDSSTDSMSDYSSYPKTYHRVFTNHAYTMQERPDVSPQPSAALSDSSMRAGNRRFGGDYYLDADKSSSNASSTASGPEYPFNEYDDALRASAYMENMEPSKPKLTRSRSAPRAGHDSFGGMLSGKMSPQAGSMGPEWNLDSWSAKLATVGVPGKKRSYGSSPSARINTSYGNFRGTWK